MNWLSSASASAIAEDLLADLLLRTAAQLVDVHPREPALLHDLLDRGALVRPADHDAHVLVRHAIDAGVDVVEQVARARAGELALLVVLGEEPVVGRAVVGLVPPAGVERAARAHLAVHAAPALVHAR